MAQRSSWTLTVAALGTLLVLADFSAVVTTVGQTARSLGAGVSGQTWALSAMSLGLATALAPLRRRRWVALWVYALAFGGVVLWWGTIQPRWP